MKLFAIIAASLATTQTNAIYHACCETTSTECPTNYLNVGTSDKANLACCNKNETPTTVNLPTCIEPIENGNGPSIMVMSLTEDTPSNGDEVSITNLPEVTTTSTSTSNCCEVAAAVQPGKVRKTPKTYICPAEMFSVGTVYMKEEGTTNYQMCCDTEEQTNEVNKVGISTCPTTTEEPDTTQEGPGEPTQISEPPKEEDKPIQINEPDNVEQDVQEEEKEDDGTNGASTMGVAAVGMAFVGVTLQMLL